MASHDFSYDSRACDEWKKPTKYQAMICALRVVRIFLHFTPGHRNCPFLISSIKTQSVATEFISLFLIKCQKLWLKVIRFLIEKLIKTIFFYLVCQVIAAIMFLVCGEYLCHWAVKWRCGMKRAVTHSWTSAAFRCTNKQMETNKKLLFFSK